MGLETARQSARIGWRRPGRGHQDRNPAPLGAGRAQGTAMDEPSDPADTTFQRLLDREILVSERRRMLTLAAVAAVILALILLAVAFAPGFARSIYHDRVPVRAASAAFSAFIAYELLAAALLTFLIRRGLEVSSPRPLHERPDRDQLSDFAALSPHRLSLPARRLRDMAGAALFRLHHSLDPAARFCAFGFHRSGRRGRALRPRLGDAAPRLAHRRPELQRRLSSGAQRRPHRGRSHGRLGRGDDQAPLRAGAGGRVGPRPGDQPLRSARLAAGGRAASRHRRRRAQRNEAGLRDVRRHSRLHRSLAQPHARPKSSPASTPFSRSWSTSSIGTTAS